MRLFSGRSRGDGEDANAIVAWQGDGLRSCRDIDGVSVKVRVIVDSVAAIGGVEVGCIPRHGRPLDEAGRESHVAWLHDWAVRLREGERAACALSFLAVIAGRRSGRRRNGDCLPLAVVPLADVAGPVLDGEWNRRAPDLEGGLLIPTIRCCEQVEAAVVAFGQIDGLPVGRDCVRLTFGCGREVECNAVVDDFEGSISPGKDFPSGSKPPVDGLFSTVATDAS